MGKEAETTTAEEKVSRVAALKPAAGAGKKAPKKDSRRYRITVDKQGALVVEVSTSRGRG